MKFLQILVLISCFCFSAYGQSSNKVFSLSGTVYDINKAVVVGAEITVNNTKGKIHKARTNDSGEYEIVLPIGSYTITFNQNGFKTLRVINLEVNSEIKKNLDVTLEVGRCEDCNGALYGERWDDFAILSGVIYDSSGAAIENAKISFRDSENKERNIKTGKNGGYKIKLPNGVYSIEVQATGFKVFKIEKYKATGTYNGMKFDVVLEVKNCDDPTINCSSITADPIKNKFIRGN
jgi:hypothetical protein